MFHSNDTLHVSKISLLVLQLKRSLEFYQDILGFRILKRTLTSVLLSADGKNEMIELIEDPHAIPLGFTQGLYHFAILMKKRSDLASILKHLISKRYPITGASDHGVSEAIYLDDPDGHGIEIYIDKPIGEWPKENGIYTMYTHALDMESLMKESISPLHYQIASDAMIGHLHFHVPSLKIAQSFYVDILGFQIFLSDASSVVFISDGGYHHHLGLNTWQTGAPLCEKRQIGLKSYVLDVPDKDYLSLIKRLHSANIEINEIDGNPMIVDPLGQKVFLNRV